jgi:hypothetical protein
MLLTISQAIPPTRLVPWVFRRAGIWRQHIGRLGIWLSLGYLALGYLALGVFGSRVFDMAVRIIALLAICFATVSLPCFGQEAEDFPDQSLTREQWQQRVQDARRRSEQFVATAREQRPDTPITPAQKEQEAADRALNDPTLHQGDVISTGKGFVVFVGRDEEHRPNDFVSTPNQPHPR